MVESKIDIARNLIFPVHVLNVTLF